MISGKEYNFVLGEINDELVDEYKELLIAYSMKIKNTNLIGYKVANGELELTDELVFQTAICFAKDYLKEVLDK